MSQGTTARLSVMMFLEYVVWGAWLPHVGVRKTKDFAFLHGTMDGIEAQRCGWATRSVARADLEDTVDRMAAEIARMPLEILMMKKRAINKCVNNVTLCSAIANRVQIGSEFILVP